MTKTSIYNIPEEVQKAIDRYYDCFDEETGELIKDEAYMEAAAKHLEDMQNRSDDLLIWYVQDLQNRKLRVDMIDAEIERTVWDAKDDQIIPEKMESMKLFERECRNKLVCTMQHSIDLCKLPGKFGSHKWPKLQELHKHLYGEEFDSAHNALNDIRATERCFDTLVEKGIIKL